MQNKIEKFKNKFPKLSFYMTYTVLFLIMYELCYGMYFQIAHKSFIWKYDGLEGAYPSFVYVGRWVRTIIKNIFIEHKLVIPMWDMSIGYGKDVFSFIGGNAYRDPFMLFSVLCPSKYSEIMFDFVLILKMYIAGITFCIYARCRGNDKVAVLAGALIYTFSGPVFITFRQWGIIYTFIYFPLLMLGVENIWEGKKPFLYMIILTYFMSNYSYYAFMCCIFIFGYCIVKCIADHKKYNKKQILNVILNFLFFSTISIIFGALIGYSYIGGFVGMDRLKLDYFVPTFYNKEYNINIYSGFITGFDGGNDWVIGFSVVVLISIFAVLVDKGFIKEKLCVIILTCSVFIPFIGHVFNGFKYATNRWIWGYDFLIAYLIVIMSERIRELSNIKKCVITVLTIIYGVVLIFVFKVRDELTILISVVAIMICLALFVMRDIPKKIYNILYLWIVIITILLPCYYWFSAEKHNLPSVEVDKGTAYDIVMESGGKFLLNYIPPDTLIRYDTQSGSTRNSSIMYGLSAMNFYTNMYNNDIDKLHNDLALCTSGVVQSYNGLDKRSTLEYLMGVEYYLFNYGEYVPYGFDVDYKWGVSEYYDKAYFMYERSNSASIIYAFDKAISYEDYEALDAYQKQKALMYGLVFDDETIEAAYNITDIEEKIGNDSVKYEITDSYGLEYKDNQINVYEEKAYMVLSMESVSNCELYVLVNHLMLNDTNKMNFEIAIEAYNNDTKLTNKYYTINTPSYHMYGGRDSKLVNLNGVNDGANKIKITFNTLGNYRIDDIKIYAESFDEIDGLINGLNNCSVGDTFSDNKIKSSIQLDKDEYVFISVPYAEGWTAYLDGEETEIYKVDEAFMAVRASKGIHNLELEYKTPYIGLTFGLWVVYVVLVIAAIVIKIEKKHK